MPAGLEPVSPVLLPLSRRAGAIWCTGRHRSRGNDGGSAGCLGSHRGGGPRRRAERCAYNVEQLIAGACRFCRGHGSTRRD